MRYLPIGSIAVLIICLHLPFGVCSAYTIQMAEEPLPSDQVVSIGSWYRLSDSDGWTFRPDTDVDHVELALYDSTATLTVGTTPFAQHFLRTSGSWPDGPENEQGELGYEVSPHVLGDNNQHLYGKPHYRSLRLFGGHLSADIDYRVSFADSVPDHIWLHPVRSRNFTMSADILQSSEGTLTNPVYGPASVNRTIVSPDSTRFEYTGLSPDFPTGLKDDYPVGDYDQRSGSHGNGDFGWFPGYSLWFCNEGPGAVIVALFVTTGFTGPSGAPSGDLANDTFWKSDETAISVGDTATLNLEFDDVQGFNLSDNPFPHTAGGQSAPDGTTGAAINVFDRLQVSAIGWEVRSVPDGPADASLVITARATSINPITAVPDEVDSPIRVDGLRRVAPNPFNPRTAISFVLEAPGPATVEIYDLAGHRVTVLCDQHLAAGRHTVDWDGRAGDGRSLPSGAYLVRLTTSRGTSSQKAVLVR